jgi:metacaspase-1
MSFYPGLGYQGGQSHHHGGYLPPQQPHPPQGYGSPPPQVYPLSLLTLYSSSDVSDIDKERRQGGFGGFGGYGPPQAPPSPQPRHDYNRPPSHSPQPPFNGGYNVSVGDALVGYDDADLEPQQQTPPQHGYDYGPPPPQQWGPRPGTATILIIVT